LRIVKLSKIIKIELDLLKSYVLNFYESLISDSAPHTTSTSSTEAATPVEKVATPVAAPVVEANTPAIEEKTVTAQQAPSEDLGSEEVKEEVKVDSKESPEMDALFSLEKGNEISDKLSMTPIKDLTKAMNINERIFTLKELFGNNKEQFDETMLKLNGLNNYAEATAYLSSEVVEQNGWLDPTKTKKVKTFLKLIARKYV